VENTILLSGHATVRQPYGHHITQGSAIFYICESFLVLLCEIILHWTTNFYKSHVSEIKLAISYHFLCAEHKYDIQIAKLALVFL